MSVNNTSTPRDRPFTRQILVLNENDYFRLISILSSIERKKVIKKIVPLSTGSYLVKSCIKKQEQMLIQLSIEKVRFYRVDQYEV